MEEQTPETLQDLELVLNPELFLDTLLMEIRGASIKYSATKKRNRKAQEQKLNHDIEILEFQLQTDVIGNDLIKTELEPKKDSLTELLNYKVEGAFIRSRVKYKLEGEKPSSFFCNLEKFNGVQKYIPQLIVSGEGGTEQTITDQKKNEKKINHFYTDLFQNKDELLKNESIDTFLGSSLQGIPKLSEDQKTKMEGNINLSELTQYLKKCKNNVSPGSSGYTFEFYKFFWRNIKHHIIKAVTYAFDNNKLAASQSIGMINIIPKDEKDKRYLKNWRPLCLLNSLYKLISGTLAERIKPNLDTIIHSDQKGFVSGRYIGEVVRTTYDIIQYAKENDLTGVLLTVDFEKAYDSISFSYIEKCLNFYNFGPDIKKWIKILLNNFKACTNHCGNISTLFSIGRGC